MMYGNTLRYAKSIVCVITDVFGQGEFLSVREFSLQFVLFGELTFATVGGGELKNNGNL